MGMPTIVIYAWSAPVSAEDHDAGLTPPAAIYRIRVTEAKAEAAKDSYESMMY
jgi:hypothetical protein